MVWRSTTEDCSHTTSEGGHESCLEVPELRPRPPQRRAKAVQNLRGTETRATSGHTKPTCSDGHDEVLGTSTRQSQPAGLQASSGCKWTAGGCKQRATWHRRSHGAEPSGATALEGQCCRNGGVSGKPDPSGRQSPEDRQSKAGSACGKTAGEARPTTQLTFCCLRLAVKLKIKNQFL